MRSLPHWVAALFVSLLIAAPTAHADVLDADPFARGALAAAADVPDEFVEETAFDDLVAPASIAFAPDGRVFVAQLDGVIKVYRRPSTTRRRRSTPTCPRTSPCTTTAACSG